MTSDAYSYALLLKIFPQKSDRRWRPIKIKHIQREITIDLPLLIEELDKPTPIIIGSPDMKIYLV